jgi:cobalt-zinc-cadmium efflux system outer membrane protein
VQSQTQQRLGSELVHPRCEEGQAEISEQAQALLQHPLTADSATQVALWNNRHLRATLEELGISQAELALASTPPNPGFSVSTRWTGGGPNPEFALAQDVLSILLLPLHTKMAQTDLEQAKRRVTHEVIDLAFETREAFYTLQGEEHLLERLNAVAEVMEASSQVAKRLNEAGNITDLELREQETGVIDVELKVRRSRGQIIRQREKLNRLMGISGNTGWSVTPHLANLPPREPSTATLEQRALSQRLDLALAKGRLEQVERAMGLKCKTRFLPVLNLGASTERDPDGTNSTGPSAEIQLPIFNRGESELAKLAAQKRQALEEIAALKNDIRSEVSEAAASVAAARGVVDLTTTKLLPNHQEILRQSLLQYNAMQISNFDLLAAKDREINAEREAAEALREYWLARVALERSIGGRIDGEVRPAKVAAARVADHL